MTVAADTRVTFGALQAGMTAKGVHYSTGGPALRFYKTKELQLGCLPDVEWFRDEDDVHVEDLKDSGAAFAAEPRDMKKELEE